MNEDRHNHLNMIQAVIDRMGQNSFHLKGWAVGIMIAIFTFSAGRNDLRSILFTIIPLFVIWILDSYYLNLERKFRLLYDEVRKKKEIDFDMNFSDIKLQVKDHYKVSLLRCIISRTEVLFYLTCILTTVLIYIFA